jgi:diamine N-acetyltransferase
MTTPRIRLRPTMLSDIPFVLSLEEAADNLPFITPWERPQHEAAVRFADMRHFVIEAVGHPSLDAVGFAILIGCRNPHRSVELKRMVVGPKAQGFGRAALKVMKKVAFDELGAHRFWLDVKGQNTRAKALYETEGFVQEGRLREAVKTNVTASGFDDLIVLSMLQTEFVQRRAQALEAML